DLGYQNEKAYNKSLEQGHLWVLHGETGRLLPYEDGSQVEVAKRDGWYLATLVTRTAGSETGSNASKGEPDPSARTSQDDEAEFGAVAGALAALVEERKRTMPEGSYTTHLFSSGAEKIRKKLGEEAVELILAPDRHRLVSETADLIYHLLVLLASEGVTLADVAAELEQR
ncbi:MAG: phosphoribosyl-ATP diphosphatase, partial [Spirochaetales bacterium]